MSDSLSISSIREHYRSQGTAEAYLADRFGTPVGWYKHWRQVQFIHEVIQALEAPVVVEVAPGPARLTAHIGPVGLGCAVDTSLAMLAQSRARLRGIGKGAWDFVVGDGFQLPLKDGVADVVISFRFLWHFHRDQRSSLLAEMNRILNPRGTLIMDAPNAHFRSWFARKDPRGTPVPAFPWSLSDLIQELRDSDLEIARALGNMNQRNLQDLASGLHRLRLSRLSTFTISLLERLPSSSSEEWLIACVKQ